MDTKALRDLLKDALEEVGDDDNPIDRLAAAVERLAEAIEKRPNWYYPYVYPSAVTYTTSDNTGASISSALDSV